jgi:hypothetical protein
MLALGPLKRYQRVRVVYVLSARIAFDKIAVQLKVRTYCLTAFPCCIRDRGGRKV